MWISLFFRCAISEQEDWAFPVRKITIFGFCLSNDDKMVNWELIQNIQENRHDIDEYFIKNVFSSYWIFAITVEQCCLLIYIYVCIKIKIREIHLEKKEENTWFYSKVDAWKEQTTNGLLRYPFKNLTNGGSFLQIIIIYLYRIYIWTTKGIIYWYVPLSTTATGVEYWTAKTTNGLI